MWLKKFEEMKMENEVGVQSTQVSCMKSDTTHQNHDQSFKNYSKSRTNKHCDTKFQADSNTSVSPHSLNSDENPNSSGYNHSHVQAFSTLERDKDSANQFFHCEQLKRKSFFPE
jgi:hypothetical protein